ncbi:MAG: hypothetical protein HEQ16_06025 [Bosea sp.]|nr:hypothetical protein [Bosea sp. (in: a-proteobacteria)]
MASRGPERLLGGALTLLRPELADPPARDLPRIVDVFGAGRAVRALLTVAALHGTTLRFRIWCRHHSRAELLRIHLADLPPLAVEIVASDAPPGGGAGPLVLALGLRTSRRSRQRSKDALFTENMAIIEGLMPALAGRTVIVVTNPSTQLTARLCEQGVRALGVGVMNDQLRFERDAGEGWRLVGAHNPFELGFGLLGSERGGDELSFTRAAYRDLANRQDRLRPLLDPDGLVQKLSPGLHERAWRDLGALHDGLDLGRRWYARQRLASRYLENGVACGRAILGLVDLLTGEPVARPDITVEAPLRFCPGDGAPQRRAVVMGWPWDAVTGEPRALGFGAGALPVIRELASRYGLDPVGAPPGETLVLGADGAPSIRCRGAGLGDLVADIVPLASRLVLPSAPEAEIDIRLVDDAACLAGRLAGADAPLQQVAQHRGKNVFEHRDLTIQPLPGGRRMVAFSASGARAMVDDVARQIVLAAPPGPGRRDEFRKLVRDQILTPAYAAAGAWVLHAGLVRHGGAGLLLLGDSGAGKTTGALHLLAGAERGAACAYGASERVLVLVREGRLMALGVPESLTVFRGSLRALPAFCDLVEGQDPAGDWSRAHKLRISRDAVVQRLGTCQIAGPIAVTHVALLRYRPGLARALIAPAPSAAFRREALGANDLTTQDDVRAAWLGWFAPCRDSAVPERLSDPALPFSVIDWSSPPDLAAMLAACAAGGGTA